MWGDVSARKNQAGRPIFHFRFNRSRSFQHYSTTKNRFGYDFRCKEHRLEHIANVQKDQDILDILKIEIVDKPAVYASLIPYDLFFHEFIVACLEGLITRNPLVHQYLSERLRLEGSDAPLLWQKISKRILENEETLRALTDLSYLKKTQKNFLYDVIQDVEESIDAKKSYGTENDQQNDDKGWDE
jgi:hypothetical protein